MRTKLLTLLLIAAITVVVPAAPATAEEPADMSSTNRPTPVAGAENGRVPSDKLITAWPGCQVERTAASGAALLFRQARSRNIDLYGNGCYRPIARQQSLYAQNTASGGPCTAQPQTHPDGRPKGTSNHGWGKAIDFGQRGATLTFSSSGYRFLTQHAEAAGWVHPNWAGPGQRCAEPWHWEFVGDGGTQNGPVVRADVVSAVPTSTGGLLLVTGLGDAEARDGAVANGSMVDRPLAWVMVDGSPTTTGNGYWMLAGDGGVFTFGDAEFFGSTGDRRLNAPAVAMAATATGKGYWFVASDGGIFTFGDARFFGSLGDKRLNSPIVGMAPTPSGNGYWLVASDGGIFTFGDARFHGSTGAMKLNEPIVGMAPTPTGDGYWLAAEDGGIFTFGDATFLGSGAADGGHGYPFVDLAPTAAGGYRIVAADGLVVTMSPATAPVRRPR